MVNLTIKRTDKFPEICGKLADLHNAEAFTRESLSLLPRFYVYCQPGEVRIATEQEAPPEGFELVQPSIPRNATRDQVRNWLRDSLSRMPIYPTTD